MKGHCQDCNRTYVRLDKHRNYMHGDGKSLSLKKNIKKAETEKSQKTISSTPTSHDAMVEPEEKLAGEKEEQEIEREEEGGEEIEEQDAKKCRYLGNFPWYFYVPTEFLHGQKANDREYIDLDDHSCQLAHYLNQNSLRWWLKKNCNPITLMSLAYMVHLMNYPQIVQPAHLKPFNKRSLQDLRRRNPKKMARYQKFFKEMNNIVLQFQPLFQKYPDLIKRMIGNYAQIYK